MYSVNIGDVLSFGQVESLSMLAGPHIVAPVLATIVVSSCISQLLWLYLCLAIFNGFCVHAYTLQRILHAQDVCRRRICNMHILCGGYYMRRICAKYIQYYVEYTYFAQEMDMQNGCKLHICRLYILYTYSQFAHVLRCAQYMRSTYFAHMHFCKLKHTCLTLRWLNHRQDHFGAPAHALPQTRLTLLPR